MFRPIDRLLESWTQKRNAKAIAQLPGRLCEDAFSVITIPFPDRRHMEVLREGKWAGVDQWRQNAPQDPVAKLQYGAKLLGMLNETLVKKTAELAKDDTMITINGVQLYRMVYDGISAEPRYAAPADALKNANVINFAKPEGRRMADPNYIRLGLEMIKESFPAAIGANPHATLKSLVQLGVELQDRTPGKATQLVTEIVPEILKFVSSNHLAMSNHGSALDDVIVPAKSMAHRIEDPRQQVAAVQQMELAENLVRLRMKSVGNIRRTAQRPSQGHPAATGRIQAPGNR